MERVDFVQAQELWQDPMRIEVPARTSGEPRWLVIGRMGGKHWSAVVTYREDRIRIRREGAAAEPVAFGSHRKPEAILIPYEAYERYEALARQRARLDNALSAAQSVQVELPGAFSPEHDREVSAYVDGEMSAAELYRRTVSRYRRP